MRTANWLLPGIFFASALAAAHVVGPWLIAYDLGADALLIRLGRGGPILRRIPYESIVEVRVASFIDIVFAVKWLNRLAGSAVLLHLDRGWWRTLVISPAEPESFVGAVRGRMRPVLVV
jgi:hypothetical protein